MDFQGSYSYSYKTNPFGFIEFLELKRGEGVRGEKRTRRETFFETDEKEKKISEARGLWGRKYVYSV